jgi:hypothetical protein
MYAHTHAHAHSSRPPLITLIHLAQLRIVNAQLLKVVAHTRRHVQREEPNGSEWIGAGICRGKEGGGEKSNKGGSVERSASHRHHTYNTMKLKEYATASEAYNRDTQIR